MKYESPTSSGEEAMTKVKVFLKVGQTSRSRSLGHAHAEGTTIALRTLVPAS